MPGLRHLLRSGHHATGPVLGRNAVRPVAPRRALAATHLRIVLGAVQDPYGEDIKTTRLLDRTVAFTNWETLHHQFDTFYLDAAAAFATEEREPRIVDVGADIGISTIWFATAHPEARITAIERDPSTFELLRRNLDQNGLGHVDARLATAAAVSHRDDVPSIRISDLVDGPVDLLRFDQYGAELDAITDLVETGAIESVRCIAMEFRHADPGADARLQQLYALLDSVSFRHIVLAGTPERDERPAESAKASLRDAA
jgi:hypothetical protein